MLYLPLREIFLAIIETIYVSISGAIKIIQAISLVIIGVISSRIFGGSLLIPTLIIPLIKQKQLTEQWRKKE